MLQKLNERIQGLIAWIVIILITITFTLFGIDYYLQSRNTSTAQVEINGEVIPKQAFEINYRRARQNHEPNSLTAENKLKQQVLNEMIINAVSVQAALKNGFGVNPSQADAAILRIPQFQQDGHFSANRYQQALNGALFTPQSFQKEVQQGMLLNQQRFAFIGTAFALPSEVDRFVNLYLQTRDYDYIRIPVLHFINKVKISEEEIAAYYQKHQKEFLTPEKVSIKYIKISLPEIKKTINISPEQVAQYYEENKANYTLPTQWQVEHILLALPDNASDNEVDLVKEKAQKIYEELEKQPDNFADKVKSVSDDKISAVKNGLLPWITAGQTEFDQTLIQLTKPGQISAPTKSKYGYEIFKLVSYKPSRIKTLAEVQEEIKQQILNETAETKYNHQIEQAADLSYQNPDSLEPVAQALNLNIQQTNLFSRQDSLKEFSKNQQIVTTAFSHEILQGNNSEPIQFSDDAVVILRLNKYIPSKQEDLAEVRNLIASKLSVEKAQERAQELGQQIINNFSNPSQQNKLVTENGLVWQSVENAKRESDANLATINQIAFNIHKVNSVLGQSLNNGDYAVVDLKNINNGSINSLDKEQTAAITQQIEANFGMMDYDLYINSLMQKANIIKN